MKQIVVTIIFAGLLYSLKTDAQLYNAHWFTGSNGTIPVNKTSLDFTVNPVDTVTEFRNLGGFNTNASICNADGNLRFYTNGIWIANRSYDTLENSENFNPGYASDYYWYVGLGISQGVVIIPTPNDTGRELIFHVSAEQFNAYGENQVQPLYLSMSEVNMNLDSGLGGIPSDKKNLHIIEDTITQGRLAACKHANGRDWWIITHKFYSDIFYKVLVTPDTLIITSQAVGPTQTSNDILGMAKFSPDGSKYCFLNQDLSFDLFDFDRCNGEFTNPITYSVPDTFIDLSLNLGCEFSPSGRYLYVNTYKHLYQYDLWSSDIQSSVVEVAKWDTTFLPTATWFFLPQRAPDGKIYISTYNSTNWLHVIDQPDSLGLACNVLQHNVPLIVASSTMPNFPNYQLGKLVGSPCDTIDSGATIIKGPVSKGFYFSITPNPADQYINVTYNIQDISKLAISDVMKNVVYHQTLYPYFNSIIIHVDNLPEGAYFVTIQQSSGLTDTKTFLIRR